MSNKIIVSIVGVLLVAGVVFLSFRNSTSTNTPVAATQATDATTEQLGASSQTTTSSGATPAAANTSAYKDGTYTATASYQTPESVEPITVTVTLKDGVVTDSSVTTDPQAPETRRYQSQFVAGYKQYVVGKSIDSISLSRVSGSSLTSGGFNAAVEQIKAQAKA